MRKMVDKVISHGKNFNTSDFAVMVCPECATLYENITPNEFKSEKLFFIKEGRQVQLQCRNCKCRFERKVYDKTIPVWYNLIPLISFIAWIICIVLFFIALVNKLILLTGLSVIAGIGFFCIMLFTGRDKDF